MELKLFQVDAFASKPFQGNPAAVIPLQSWLPEAQMQAIAMENNLSETAFFTPATGRGEGHYDLRWFTPTVEVDLCGHATLASAFVIFTYLKPSAQKVTFHTKSGPLTVTREEKMLAMSLPARPVKSKLPAPFVEELHRTLRVKPKDAFQAPYPLVVLESETDLRKVAVTPGMAAMLTKYGESGLIVTAHGDGSAGYEVVSRFFAPGKGIDEDPVTGSAHCTIVPYWAKEFGKNDIVCFQASKRGGFLRCTLSSPNVIMRGTCAPYLVGLMTI